MRWLHPGVPFASIATSGNAWLNGYCLWPLARAMDLQDLTLDFGVQ